MIRNVISGLFVFMAISAGAQVQTHVIGDSIRMHGNTGTTELILENSTKNVDGFLYNKGNGRTEFRKTLVRLNDSVYVLGADTLNLSTYTSGNSWKITGNGGTNPSTHFLGTVDNNRFVLKTNNQQRLSVLADGTFNIASSDTAAKPLFRVYPNGDFTFGASNNLTNNTVGPNNGIRYNRKYGILEVGTDNNFDTTIATTCCGSQAKSAIVINSDFINTFKGHLHASLVAGDGITDDTLGLIRWSGLFGESHYINGGINSSIVAGWGHNINNGGNIDRSIVGGISNSFQKRVGYSLITGSGNSAMDTSVNTMVGGGLNKYGGIGQFVSGSALINKTPFGTTLGNSNVDFTSLGYTGLKGVQLSSIANLDKYPVFAIGNSKEYNNSSFRSNAMTVLFNGRTQINTAGYDNNLVEADVIPKAALDVVSQNSGILIPRLTTTQRDNITGGDLHNGLLLYNADSSKFQFYNGSSWRSLSDVNTSSGVLGTTDGQRLIFRTNNIERATIDTAGNVGIATSSPAYKLDVNGTARISDLPFMANRDTVLTYDSITRQLKTTKIINSATEGTVVGRTSSGAGALELIDVPVVLAKGTISSTANLSIDLSNYYNKYDIIEVYFYSVQPATNAAILYMRVSPDGTNYDASSSNYKWNFNYVVGASAGSVSEATEGMTNAIQLTGLCGNSSGRGANVFVRLYNTGSSAFQPVLNYSTHRVDNSGNTGNIHGTGVRTTQQVTRGVRFVFSTGNISTGTYKVVGIKQ